MNQVKSNKTKCTGQVPASAVNTNSNDSLYTWKEIRINGWPIKCQRLDEIDTRWELPSWDQYQELVCTYQHLTLNGIILRGGGPPFDDVWMPFLEHFEAFGLSSKFIHVAWPFLEGAATLDIQAAIEDWQIKTGRNPIPIPLGVVMLAAVHQDLKICRRKKSCDWHIGQPLFRHKQALRPSNY